MQHPSRRRPPPWQRRDRGPRHPIGRTRRRFPRSAGETLPTRYARAYDGAGEHPRPADERRSWVGPRLPRRPRGLMEQMRRNPGRSGLVGLAVAGTAVPMAIARQQDTRTDPSHEQILPSVAAQRASVSDRAVGEAWRAASEEVAVAKVSAREAKVAEKVAEFREYDVPRDLAEDIYDIALEEDVDPDVAFGLVRAESEFKNSATSHVGAVGLTQLMPKTARWLQPGTTVQDLRDTRTNLRIGFKYLKQLTDKYDGNENLALLAYNRGPGTVDRILKRGGDPNNGYIEMVKEGRGH